MAKPFTWLASFPKSGNTWVRIFLGCYLNDGPVDINSLPLAVCHSDLKQYYYRACAPKSLADMSQYEVTNLRGTVLQHMYANGQWPIVMKTHHARTRLHGVDLIPDGLSRNGIYLVRDPRDVVVSFANHTDNNIEDAVDMLGRVDGASCHEKEPSLIHFTSSWSNHVNSWMTTKGFPVKCFKYETMVREPEEQFANLVEFLGWEVDRDRVARAVEFSSFDKLQSQEQLAGFKELQNGNTFFRRGRVGNWQDVLTEEQANRIEANHKEVMQKLGYI